MANVTHTRVHSDIETVRDLIETLYEYADSDFDEIRIERDSEYSSKKNKYVEIVKVISTREWEDK